MVRPTNLKERVKLNGNFQRGGGGVVFSGAIQCYAYVMQCGGKPFLQTCIPKAIFKVVP